MPEELRVDINEYQHVTALVYSAKSKGRLGITLILGHGAGSGQTHGFMVGFATELATIGPFWFSALKFDVVMLA